jgi:hypothetical protein
MVGERRTCPSNRTYPSKDSLFSYVSHISRRAQLPLPSDQDPSVESAKQRLQVVFHYRDVCGLDFLGATMITFSMKRSKPRHPLPRCSPLHLAFER